MASKYITKYRVPEGFDQIVRELTRQVLRDQPSDILDFCARYFELLDKNNRMGIKKKDNKDRGYVNFKTIKDISEKAQHSVQLSNEAIRKEKEAHPDDPREHASTSHNQLGQHKDAHHHQAGQHKDDHHATAKNSHQNVS